MSDGAARLDAMSDDEAREALTRCCGASRWVAGMLEARPFGSADGLRSSASAVWATMERADVLEAFEHHPRIGADVDQLRAKFAATSGWSVSEQAGAVAASEETLLALRDANVEYEARFGHIFIVCATGKSAEEMLGLLRARLDNDPDDELRIAAAEQHKITELRLAKLDP